ncbi:hypothetical protein, partial [Yersinia pestis]
SLANDTALPSLAMNASQLLPAGASGGHTTASVLKETDNKIAAILMARVFALNLLCMTLPSNKQE